MSHAIVLAMKFGAKKHHQQQLLVVFFKDNVGRALASIFSYQTAESARKKEQKSPARRTRCNTCKEVAALYANQAYKSLSRVKPIENNVKAPT